MAMLLSMATLGAQSAPRAHDPEWRAPAHATSRTNPLAGRPEIAAGGRKLFDERCSSCHGDDRRGTPKAPDLLEAAVQAQTDGELFWKLTTGNSHTGMPSFSFLPALQRWQIVMHLRSAAAAPARGCDSTKTDCSGVK